MRYIATRAAWAVVLISLAACGGGGGGGGNSNAPDTSVSMTLDRHELTWTFVEAPNGNLQAPMSVQATFTGLPKGEVYPVLTVDKAVFSAIDVYQALINDNSQYVASFTPDNKLAAGTYSGTATLQLFKNSAHTAQYTLSGATVSYKIVVTTHLKTTLKIDGVVRNDLWPNDEPHSIAYLDKSSILWASGQPACATLNAGQTIEVESNIPVSWFTPGDLAFNPYRDSWTNAIKSSTTLRQVVPTFSMGYSGAEIVASSSDGGMPTGFCFNIRRTDN